jgi:methyltransferase (TIGR00027 family)
LGVARVRARESSRPDRLFDDPYAAAFAAAGPEDVTPRGADASADGPPSRAALAFQIVIRTRFFDDFVLAATGAGCHQVVLLAAGLDTRAFRLEWPAGVHAFELDLPAVLAFKEAVLGSARAEPTCRRSTLAIDLREDWPARLIQCGFEPGRRTTWLVEGLLVYLEPADAASLLLRIGQLSTAGSQLAFELGAVARDVAGAGDVVVPGTDPVLSLWRGGLDDDAAVWLGRNGWEATAHDLGSVAASYGRPASVQTRSGFVTATRATVGDTDSELRLP